MANDISDAGARGRGSGNFAVLKIRNFRYYWGATIFSVIGEHIENVIRNWLIWDLTHSRYWLQVMVTMHWIPHAIFAIPAGSIADRVNRQRVIFWSEIWLMLAATGMFITTNMDVMSVYWMSALLILHSTAGSISNPCRQLFVHDMVGREHLLSGVALTSSLRFATMSIGKPIGGLILLTLGAAFGFFVNALAFIPLILALLTAIRVTQREEPKRRHVFEEFKQGLKYIRSERTILAIICIATAPAIFIGSGFDPFMVIYADSVFGMGAEGYTYFITAVGLGALVGVVALGRIGNVRWKGQMLFIGVFGFCISMVGFAFSQSFFLSLVFLFLFGLFQVLHNSSATTMLLENVPSEMRGRVMGIFNFGRLGLRVVNGPFFIILRRLAALTTASAFVADALTISTAGLTVALVTLGIAIVVPSVSKQE
ncbi:MAG: MFS transporter [Deltaproteobacteria bacterium]|nr:MFS transporter [Deltaproteobacteria bacterium]